MKRYIRSSIADVAEEDIDVRLELADSLDTVPEVLTRLLTDTDYFVRDAAIQNPNTPIKSLCHLYDITNNPDIGTALSLRADTPSKMLQYISRSSVYMTQCGLASNINTPTEALNTLARHATDFHVRKLIAENPNVSIELLEKLSNDRSKKVSATAKNRLAERSAE